MPEGDIIAKNNYLPVNMLEDLRIKL